ncbi:hypothetical protein TGDOM2_217800 [Toxoplasma gondii GAB2-2007-GAL-DOM2]|uniref:Uncharacterized protein n=2 Tax=Toxoplasma gondii TaxID=5811 RepID=A0A086L1M8_TOXGO|nr:hypothetical protein TGDOM2_217800 [Toxoplasma gondii GAB2-2007-GAL-DOM2]KFG50546.1 hypothetical protein TGFOU_217800 [Toxoplasma gondii FOU]
MPFMDAYAQQGTPGVQPEVYIQPVAGVPQLPHTYFGAHMNHGGFSSLPHSRPNPLWLSGTPSNPPGGPQGGQQGEGYFHMYPGFPSPEDSPLSASSFGSHKGASYSQVEDPTGRYGINESLLAGDPQTSQRDTFWPSATPAGAFQVPPRQPARMPGQQSQMDYSTGGYPSSFPNPPVSRLPHYAFSSGVSPERQFGAYAARDPAAGYFDIGQQPAWPYQVPNAPEAYAQQSQDPLHSSGAQRAFNSSYGSGDQARFLPPVKSEQPHGSPHGEDGNKAGAEYSVPSFYSDSSAFGDEYVPRYYAPKSFNTADVQGTKGTQPTDRPANWGAAPRRAAHAGARRELREPSRQEQKTYFDRVTEEDEGKEKADGRDGGGKEREKEREAWTEEQDVVDRRLCLARTPIEAILVTGDFAGKACLEDEEQQKWRKRLYELWQGVLPLDKRNRETFLRGLYYETRLRSRANIRILVLNSFLYSVPANDDPRGSPVSSSSTPETTEGARESDEEQDDPRLFMARISCSLLQVILAGHIPPGVAEDAEDSFEGRSKPLWKAKFTRRGRDPTWSLLLFSPYTYTQRLPESRSPVFAREDWPVKELLLPRPRYVLQDLFSYSLSLHFAAESPLESLETDVETALGFREAGRKLQADSLSRKAARASERNQCGRQAAAADAAKTTEREREGQERDRRRKERKDDSPNEAVNPLEKSASPSPSAAAGKTEAPVAGGASEDRRRLSSPCPPTDTKSGTTEGEGTEEDGGEGDDAAVKGGENHECAREDTVDNERAREAAEEETAEREAAETNEAEVKEARKNRSERKAPAEQEGAREAAEVDGIAWSASERGERENDTIEEEELTRHETPIHDWLATARKEKRPQTEEQKDSEPSLRIAVEPAFSPFVQEESRQSVKTDVAPVSDPSLPSLDRTTVEAGAERNRNAGKVDFEQEAQSSRQTAVWKRSTASTSRAPVEIAEAAGRKKETHDKERSGDAGAEGESVDRQMAFNAHHVGTQDAGVCKQGRATDAVSSPSTGRSSESFELPPLPPVSPVDGTSVGCGYSSTESLAVARDSASSTERAASPSASANEERRRRRLHVAQPAFMLHYVFTSVHRAPCLAAPVLAELAERGRDRRHFFALQMLLQAFSPQAPPASVYCETRFLEASDYLACLRTLTKNRHRDKRERAGET